MQQELAYIYEVYQCGSFSKAAAKLYMTQPALSIAIRKMEERIGYPIFSRHTKPLQLTEAGEIYVRNILQMKQLDENLANELQDLAHLDEGELHVGGTQYFNAHVLPTTLKKYMAAYPKVDLALLEDNSGKIDHNLEDGSVDITLHCGSFDTNKYVGYGVFRDYLLLAVPKSFALNKKYKDYRLTKKDVENGTFLSTSIPAIKLNWFQEEPFLILTKSNNLRQRALSMFQQAGFAPKIRFSVEQLETSVYLANAQLGATFLSDKIIRDAQATNLFYYKLAFPEATRDYKAILHKNSYHSHIMKTFITMVQDTWTGSHNEYRTTF